MKELHSVQTSKGYINIGIDLDAKSIQWLDKNKIFRTRQAAHQRRERLERKAMEDLLEQFLESDDFKSGVISATRASWGGSGYSVELLPETNTWRELWNNQIGNKYDSPGVILALPTFTDDGTYQEAVNGENPISEEEYFDLCFANEGEELKQEVRDSLAAAA